MNKPHSRLMTVLPKDHKLIYMIALAVILFSTGLITLSTAMETSTDLQGNRHNQSENNPAVSTWYLADGYTGAGFWTYFLIQNPAERPADVQIVYYPMNGKPITRSLSIAAHSRSTIAAQEDSQIGMDEIFATCIEADQLIIVERSMYWPNGNGSLAGNSSAGIQQPAATWYLSEGYTGNGFKTLFLLFNPNDTTTKINILYMIQGGGVMTCEFSIPAKSRYTILANDPSQIGPDHVFATKIEADLPIIVERSTYFSNDGYSTCAVAEPANTWYLAEGYTDGGFRTYILIQNPANEPAHINITYMLDDGSIKTSTLTAPPTSRSTIDTQDDDQVGSGKAFSAKLQADQPIVVERSMYWPTGEDTIGGHNTIAISKPASRWYLAEGYTGGGFETFILIQNPNRKSVTVQLTYMIQNGGNLVHSFNIPGNSRHTILANDIHQVGSDRAFSVIVEADLPVVVERSTYFSYSGHVSAGVILAP